MPSQALGVKNGRVDEGEAVVVEVVADGPHDLRAHPQDGRLTARAQPQVAVIHEEVGAVLLRRDGVLAGAGADHFEGRDGELVRVGVLGVGLHLARDAQGGLLREAVGRGEGLGADVVEAHDGLHDAGAVAHLEEDQLLAGAAVVEPPLEGDGLADVLGQGANRDDGGAHGGAET